MRGAHRWLLAGSAAALATAAQAAETITYSYDARGRLVATSSSKGPVTGIGYDAAGNRSNYSVTGAPPLPSPPPPPPPPPPPGGGGQ